ncbi:MAG: MBL fold metallo-hydrolase [Bacteroidota bacterium]
MPSSRVLTASGLALGALGGAAAALRHPTFGAAPTGERLRRMQTSPQWNGNGFQNPEPPQSAGGPEILGEWLFGRTEHRTPDAPPPIARRQASDFAEPQSLRVTWLGHSTTLIEIEGRRLLIDPLFSDHASPGPLFGIRRFHVPPLPLADVPDLDAVVLTHDHYDHLDYNAVRQLAWRAPRWVCPLGVGAHLERWGVPAARITEHDWWEEADVSGIRLVCTPARHFSGRFLTDRNRTLWCGWAILGDERRVYATGDGGYQHAFADVGSRLGPFEITLAEAGAYDARWSDIHMGPEHAVDAVVDASGGLMLPVHWGTFNLAFHGWTEPAERALVAAEAAGVPIAIPRPGQSVIPEAPPAAEHWWPERPWRTAQESPIVSSAGGDESR